MKQNRWLKVVVGLVLCGAAVGARGDVWADVKHYWSFDQDINGDGKLQVSEVRDVRHWGTTDNGPTGGLGAYSIKNDGNGNPPAWRSGSVYCPARGVTLPNTSWIHFSCVTNMAVKSTDEEGNKTYELRGVTSGIEFKNGNNITGSVSVVTRVRIDRFGYHSDKYAFLLNNGESWGNKAGANIGFISKDPTYTNGNAFVMLGQRRAQMGTCLLATNVWYDVGYSIKDLGGGKAQVFFMVAGASCRFKYTENGKELYHPRHDTIRTEKVTPSSENDIFMNEENAAKHLRIGAEEFGSPTPSANAIKCMEGDCHRMAIWDRALEPHELAEALGAPASYFQAGMEDDGNGEFADASVTDWETAYEPDTAPWRRMPRALSADHPTLKLSYTPRTSQSRGLASVFRIKSTSASEAQTLLSLKIGGISFGTKVLSAGKAAEWFVKGGVLVEDANAIEVTRVSGSGTACAIDHLELTGSWMLGVKNDWNTEFTVENQAGNTTYLMNWNFKSIQRGVVGKTETDALANTYLWFKVPESLAKRYAFRFTGAANAQGYSGSANDAAALTNSVANGGAGWKEYQWPFGVALNGVEMFATDGMPNGRSYSFEIPRGTLSNGWNVIRSHLKGTANANHWFCFDFHRLEILPNPTGSIMLLR